MNLMKELASQGKTVLFSTHQRDEAAFADRVLNLSAEKIFCREEQVSSALPEMQRIPALSVLEQIQKFSFSEKAGKSGAIGKLPAVLKYILFLGLFCSALVIRPLPACGIFFILGICYALLAKYPAKKLFAAIIKIVPLLLFFCLFQMVFAPALPDEIRYCDFRFFTVTPSKILSCIKVLLRTESAMCLICGFAYSIDEIQLVKGFSDLLAPLRLLRIPSKYILVTMEIIFRFLPLLLDEATCIVKTQLVRGGLGKAKGLFGKIRSVVPLLVPLIVQSLKRAESLSYALTARGFK